MLVKGPVFRIFGFMIFVTQPLPWGPCRPSAAADFLFSSLILGSLARHYAGAMEPKSTFGRGALGAAAKAFSASSAAPARFPLHIPGVSKFSWLQTVHVLIRERLDQWIRGARPAQLTKILYDRRGRRAIVKLGWLRRSRRPLAAMKGAQHKQEA